MITNRRTVVSTDNDYYPTPSWATQKLLDAEKFTGSIWEPACGDGSMSDIIAANGFQVYSSDLIDRGFGDTNVDFLKDTFLTRYDNIITNPPFNLAEEFLDQAYNLANHKIALLLRLSFLEGKGRYKSVYSKFPPSKILVFSSRVTFYPAGQVTGGGGTTAYAWYVWDKQYSGPTIIDWLSPQIR